MPKASRCASGRCPRSRSRTIDAALRALTGRIRQRPPIYSALKRGGEPLYAKARRGEAVEVEPREVEVHAFELHRRCSTCCTATSRCCACTSNAAPAPTCAAWCATSASCWAAARTSPNCGGCGSSPSASRACGRWKRCRRWPSAASAALDACLLPIETGMAAWPAVAVDAGAGPRLGQGQAVRRAVPARGQRRAARRGRPRAGPGRGGRRRAPAPATPVHMGRGARPTATVPIALNALSGKARRATIPRLFERSLQHPAIPHRKRRARRCVTGPSHDPAFCGPRITEVHTCPSTPQGHRRTQARRQRHRLPGSPGRAAHRPHRPADRATSRRTSRTTTAVAAC